MTILDIGFSAKSISAKTRRKEKAHHGDTEHGEDLGVEPSRTNPRFEINTQDMKALGEVCGAPPEEIDKLLLVEGFAIDSELGFTDAIRRLFRIHQTPLSPTDIRDDLLKIGIGRDQVNLLSSIHTVLRRMTQGGEIEKVDDSRFVLAK